MSVGQLLLLVVAGIAGGLIGSVAGLASIATFPALLAVGLSPVAANVSNTVALVFSTTGSVTASRPELQGQRARLGRLAAAGALGGAAGGALLLLTPAGSFELAVPWLVLLGGCSMLVRRRLVGTQWQIGDDTTADHPAWASPSVLLGTVAVSVYGGYFGAGAGVIMLSMFLHATGDTLPRANAAKALVLGTANAVAALGFVLFGPVRWTAVAPLGLGLFIGGRMGPAIVRRLPADRLRIAIGLAGLGLAVKLGFDAYG